MTFRRDRHVPILLALVFVALAAVDVPRGVDGTVRQLWREHDVAAIARNFHAEGMNPLYPRIDWRGHGPGYVEGEFPLYPWLVAVTYHATGVQEVNGRLLSLAASLLTLFAFVALARRSLPPAGWIAAGTFAAFSPLLLKIGTSVQPESLMLLFYITAIWLFVRWLEERAPVLLALSMAAASAAILTKLPAAHIGVLFALLLLQKDGLAALRRPAHWIAAAACLTPPLLWYAHARGIWLEHGNSLGLSNKFHWADANVLLRPDLFIGLGLTELYLVWTPAGLLLAAIGLGLRPTGRAVRLALPWCATLAIFYLVTIRTTAEGWAAYYHAVSTAPVALLVGNAVVPLTERARRAGWRRLALASIPVAFVMLAAALAMERHSARDRGMLFAGSALLATALTAAALLVTSRMIRGRRADHAGREGTWRTLVGRAALVGAVALLPAAVLHQAIQAGRQMRPRTHVDRHACISSFKPRIPERALIAASGGNCRDSEGHRLAHNASYAFYWLERKGVNVCIEEQSVPRMRALGRDGFDYFVAERPRMRAVDGFEDAMRRQFPVIAECGDHVLFRLSPDAAVDEHRDDESRRSK